MKGSAGIPAAANFHINRVCNERCPYCFATFRDDARLDAVHRGLPLPEAVRVVNLLADAGIEKLNFAIAHDDGQAVDGLVRTEVVLTGASRTPKAPTCAYLSIRGARAANMPLVHGMPPPQGPLDTPALVVGPRVSPDRPVQARPNRRSTMGEGRDTDYVDLDQVRAEVNTTRQLFEAQGWPSPDVPRRSIEEAAAAVMNLLTEKRA